jgi:hypothetical protein
MQRSYAITVTPLSSAFQVAVTGHTGTQGGLAHCMHGLGKKLRATCGKVPRSVSMTGLYTTPGGKVFSDTQATVQA